jgi:hypothetical protein
MAVVIGVAVAIVSLSLTGLSGGTATPTLLDATQPSAALRAVTDAAVATIRGQGTVSIDLVPGSVLGRHPPAVHGTGAFDFATGDGKVKLTGQSGTEEVLFVQRAMFVRQPPPTSGASPLPAGKSWVSAGLNEKQGTGSSLPQFVDQVEVVNAGLVLNEIRWGATAARALGTKEVSGRSARGFNVTVNLRRDQSTAGSAGPTFAQVVGYQIAALASRAADSADERVTVWVSDAGQIVRMEWSPPGGGVGTTSITLSDRHGALRVRPPSTSKTVDVAVLGPAGEQEGGLGDIA